ncbi:MAG: SDR family NAD(P)-dependent oxidoreductase, partial [Alphaproteobacteria bacterium]|nr:SDR family NAD(P)-dependent oxidoreductase [Alphaproteobacteria bacterium]
MTDLKGKVALVTGSTSGIGLGMAKALASQGCNVMLNGFGDAGEIEKTRQELETQFDVKVAYSGADMSKPAEIRSLVDETVSEFGGLNILVNNAGIQRVNPVEDFKDEDWDAIIAINLSSVFHSIKAAMPHLKKSGFGRIINTASVHGLVGSVHKTAYVA